MALFILPFDHRAGLERELFGVTDQKLTARERSTMVLAKEIIFNGFKKAMPQLHGEGMILVDEEFGGPVLDRAQKDKIQFALTTEKSGSPTLEFIHGNNFGKAILKRSPRYAKALVRYIVGDEEVNKVQRARLRELSDWCRLHGVGLLLEPLLGKEQPSAKLMITMMKELINAGIRPSLWKVEGLKKSSDWKRVRTVAGAPIVVLGRASSTAVVRAWLTAAAESGQVEGFAVGRTIFMEPIKKFVAGTITKTAASEAIAKAFLGFVSSWNQAAKTAHKK